MTIQVADASWEQVFGVVAPIALDHSLSVYDASYLELAMREGLPLATLDQALARAARAAGVELLQA